MKYRFQANNHAEGESHPTQACAVNGNEQTN